MSSKPVISAIVVHWRDEKNVGSLVESWPDDDRFELLIVDNSSTLDESTFAPGVVVRGRGNLGFGGGLNLGMAKTKAPIVLFLNSDIEPCDGALEALLSAFEVSPDAAGVVPALEDADGLSQCRWQLQPLPSPPALLGQTFGLGGARGPVTAPPAGTPVEQPAAAALAIRRHIVEKVGGLDEFFFPAWFEDVDLAARLAAIGERLVYEPAARFVHAGGASVSMLGYGPFLWIFHRNLARYLAKHHGRHWAIAANLATLVASVLRLGAALVRCPRRAENRRQGAGAAGVSVLGAISGWRWPRSYAERYRRAAGE